MQFDGRQVAFQQPEILNDKSIDTNVVQQPCHPHSLVHLVVEEQGVDCGKHLGTIQMGIAYQLFDILYGIGGCGPGAESRSADIQRVGAMVHSLAAVFKILGR